MTISRNISVMAQGASSSGILAGGYGGLGASVSPTTAGNVLFTADGSVWSSTQKIVRGTVQTPTSGVAVSFTGIPSWVKRITIFFNDLSSNGTSSFIAQIGSGSYTTTGYPTGSVIFAPQNGGTPVGASTGITNGFAICGVSVSTQTVSAVAQLNNMNGNVWAFSSSATRNNGTTAQNGIFLVNSSPISLGGTLDRVQITTSNGTDTFDAGSLNIMYE